MMGAATWSQPIDDEGCRRTLLWRPFVHPTTKLLIMMSYPIGGDILAAMLIPLAM